MSEPQLSCGLLTLPDAEVAASALDRGNARAADFMQLLRRWPELKVSLEDLDGPGYLVVLGGGRGELLLRSRDSLTRRRYTLAHELAHWYLANEWDEYSDVLHSRRQSRIERWCDRFAAALLLPIDLVRSDIDALSNAGALNSTAELAGVYQVSRSAMLRRVREIRRKF